ncbi:cobalamin-binding protein [Shewanella sp. AS16]|nr:cobalamin-binding protein [Shewanella sp. AS16]
MLYAIGAGDAIVATTDHADYPEAARQIPRIGGYYGIQIEKVIELNPDLVLVWDSGNKVEDIARLQALGFKLYHSNPKTLEAIAHELQDLGKLVGHEAEANQVAGDFLASLTQIRARNQAKPEVSVFYQLWSSPLMTVAKNSWIQQIIQVCHGRNVFYQAASDYPQVSLENVLLTMPQVILQSRDEGNVHGLDWSKWPEIPAVKGGHIYQLDADLLHRAAPRALQGVRLVCDALDKAREPELVNKKPVNKELVDKKSVNKEPVQTRPGI